MSSRIKRKSVEKSDDNFGTVLREQMHRQGLEVKNLSEITGISIPSIYRYLNGERICSLEYTAAICIVMRLPPMMSEYLFNLTRSHLCRTDARDKIIAKYLYVCHYDARYTLTKCNHELIFDGYEPLTEIGTYRYVRDD